MTLLISIASSQGAWQAADCRYYGRTIGADFRATKICRLDTTDGKGVIGYSGFGAMTSGGRPFELSEWIKRCLRGKKRTLDQSLSCIQVSASRREVHLLAPHRSHVFVFVGFRDGVAIMDYVASSGPLMIINKRTQTRQKIALGERDFNWHRNVINGRRGVTISVEGSGRDFVRWDELKRLHHLVNDTHRSREHPNRVNAYLAQIVRAASHREGNQKVSPECLSVCVLPDGGGHHKLYDGSGKAVSAPALPTVANGMPVDDIINAISPTVFEHLKLTLAAHKSGGSPPPDLDAATMNKLVAGVDDTPDDRLPR